MVNIIAVMEKFLKFVRKDVRRCRLLSKTADLDKGLAVKGNLLLVLLRFPSETFKTQPDL